ncbi:hypothetical protein [Leadbetterella byssophila]|uniref:hypothetical protein n=1 Tax=Leadbetterella byssophila TaxID=316068 RepID=UPI0039A30E23
MQNITTKFLKLNVVIMTLALLTSCATSMTPMQVNNTLPTLTKSKFISQAQAEEAVKSNGCKYLVKGRNYTAPIGLTTKDDLRNGAKGIDEWVKLDGGNAYVLNNYKWVTVDRNGSTQLHIEFDTMLCE